MNNTKTYRELQFENEHVAVWKSVVSPEEALAFHRHDAGRIIVGLKGGKLKRIEQDGSYSYLDFESNKAYWLDADELHKLHGDINEGEEPIEIMVIEMKIPLDRPLPSIPIE